MQRTVFLINILTLLVTAIIVFHSYRHRRQKGGLPFFCTMVLLLSWVAGSTIDLFTQSLEAKIFWRNFIQIGMALIPLTNLWFVMEYTENKRKSLQIFFLVAAVISLTGIALTFTDSWYHLIRQSVALTQINGQFSLAVEPAFWGSLFVVFRFILMFFTIIVLALFQIRIFKSGQKQVLYILSGFLLALILLFVKNYFSSAKMDLIPMSVIFLIPNLLIAYSVFRFDFLKITPLAKDWVINSLPDGIIVFTACGKIIEVNRSAEAFFGCYIKKSNAVESLEKGAEDRLDYSDYSDFVNNQKPWQEALMERKNGIVELELKTFLGVKQYYEIESHHFMDDREHYSGSVSVIRNVTSIRLEKMMMKQQAEMDQYVQILNKQSYIDYVNRTKAGQVSFIVIDIDKFKDVNDKYGHPVGDKAILKVVDGIKQCIRKDDLVGRIGGDEFSITLMNCSKERTQEIIEDIQAAVRKETAEVIEEAITLSIGVVTDLKLPEDSFDEIYHQADKALYVAKKSGGNQTVFMTSGVS